MHLKLVQMQKQKACGFHGVSTEVRVEDLCPPAMWRLSKPLYLLKLPNGWSPKRLVPGQEAWVLDPCSYATKEGKCGKGNGVSEKDVGCSDLPVLFWREIRPATWLRGCSQWNGMLPVVKLLLSVW